MAKKRNIPKEELDYINEFENTNKKIYSQASPLDNIKNLQVKCLNDKQKLLKKAIEDNDIVISTGAPGTGKTYISLLTALHLLKNNHQYKKITLIKSLQTLNGESIGYLPGTIWEKIEPHFMSYTINLNRIFNSKLITQDLIEKEIIQMCPLTYIRGLTFSNEIVIMDETQNIDYHTFKTTITRIGNNCKLIFLGDVEQIDMKNNKESCLQKMFEIFGKCDFVGTVHFEPEDSVRHKLIPKILKILNNNNNTTNNINL